MSIIDTVSAADPSDAQPDTQPDDVQSGVAQSDAAPAGSGDALRSLVLVGLMGAGKSSVGRRLAGRLGFDFLDADIEIEKAAGASIPEIFAAHGEAAFRDGERKVIARLLEQPRIVLATGGGAFMNAETRARIRERGLSIWLKAELDVLAKRCARRSNRPLLQNGDLRGTLQRLMQERYPVYAEADISVISADGPHEAVVEQILLALPPAYRKLAERHHAEPAHSASTE
ncbi:shikimate kinase [Ferrovibrio sp.]|uniref:shikimate kinase n=1 Tax=Ferrovibrio sp. TaxID=1917215 RepID=UPI00345C2D43